MTKNVITFLMSFVIHGNSTLKAVRGLFELLEFCQEKEKRFYYVYYPDQQSHKTHTHTHTHKYIYIYITQVQHVSMHPHNLQGVLYFYFAKLQKLLRL